jgi:hypothetical protein
MNNKTHSSILFPSGRLFVAGLVAMTILAARLQAQYVSTVISNGLYEPYGVTTDPGGNVYVTDAVNNRIVKYVPGTKTVSTLAGKDGQLYSGTNNGTGSAARFSEPQGIVYVPALGGLVVVDQNNHQLRFVSLGGAVSNFAGMTGVSGSSNGAALGQAQFSYPTAIAVANDGATLYIADQGNNLIRVLTTNHMVTNLSVGGYQFDSPAAVAVDNNSNIWVADSLHQVICVISNGMTNVQVIAGNGQIGSSDSLIATNAEFDLPSGLLWDNQNNLLVISDTLNDTIRSLFWTNVQGVSGYAVQTIAGIPGTRGWVDGALGVAEFYQPIGLCLDVVDLGYYVVDTDNNVLRVLQPTQPPPPLVTTLAATAITESNATLNASVVPNGLPATVYFEWGATTNYGNTTTQVTLTNNLTAANPVSFTLTGLPPNTVTHFQAVAINNSGTGYGGDRSFITSAIEADAITLAASSVTSSNATLNAAINPENVPTSFYFEWGPTTNYGNFTATNLLSTNLGSEQSVAVLLTNLMGGTSNHFQVVAFNSAGTNFGGDLTFVTLPVPPVVSINPSHGYFPECQTITVTSSVQDVYYTEDGSTPTTNSAQVTLALTNGNYVGTFQWCNPQVDLSSLQIIAVNGTNESQVLTGTSPTNNQLGFVRSPFSGIGSWAFIPIVLDLQSNASIESVQFLVEVTPSNGAPAISSLTLLPITSNDFVQFIGPAPGNAPVTLSTIPETNSTSTNGQALLVYTYGPGTGLDIQGFGVVGLLEFQIPTNASTSQSYSLNILYPSGTAVGGQIGVPIGAMPSQTLTVADLPYLVGDSAPAYGYSAEEFGDGILDNRDVNNAIYASLGVRVPPVNSDIYNAMCVLPQLPGTILNGSKVVTYNDWNEILLRSVGLDLPNWIRFWTNQGNGGVLFGETTNAPAGLPGYPAVPTDDAAQASGSPPGLVWLCQASVGAGTVTNLVPGNTCSLPVYVNVLPGCSLSGFQFLAVVSPNGNAPPVGKAQFNPAVNIPSPMSLLPLSGSGLPANDIPTAWELGAFTTPLQNSNYIGTISFEVPATAQAGQSYAVHFSGLGGSPDVATDYAMESFPGYAWVLSTALQPASITSDEWKLHFFGSLTNSLAGDDVDADGDGAPNWQEYLAGTDPTNSNSVFEFNSAGISTNGVSGLALSWLTAPGKTYILETIPALGGQSWTPINTNTGDGYTYQFIQTKYNGNAQFYRILLQP